MGKKSDQRAGGFETDDTGSMLSGLLADEEHFDRHAMFRLGTWGVASVGAVVIAVLANQMAFRSRRDEVAALDLARQSQQIQSVARESQNETRRLASAIDTLNSDRDRLYTRLTGLEQGLDSVTGTIAKQSATGPQASLLAAPPATMPQPAVPATPPEPAPVTATAVVTPAPEKPRTDSKKPPQPAAAPLAVAVPAPTSASQVSANPASASLGSESPASASPVFSAPPPVIPAPLMASKSMMAPPDAGAGKLIEPEPPKIAAAMPPVPPAQPTSSITSAPMIPATPQPEPTPPASASTTTEHAEAEPALSSRVQVAVNHTEFGVDVGTANSVGGLRAMWRGLLKSRSNAALATLQPIIVVKERDNGLGLQLRLVAGPLGDAAAAAKICAVMATNQRPCETTVFDGQRLALKNTDEPTATETMAAKPVANEESPDKSGSDNPAAAKPGATKPTSHRRNAAKRAAAEEAAKKPETPPSPPPSSGLSSFFSRNRTQ